jgi:hypothetical protein
VKPPHDIVQTVRAELATPGLYHLHRALQSSHVPLLWQLFQWLYDRYVAFERALFSRLKLHGAVGVLGDVVVVLCVIAIAFVLARVLAALQSEGRARSSSTPIERARSAHALALAAAQAASERNYARASRLLFSAAVLLLDLRGVLPGDQSATVNQLRRELLQRGGGDEAAFSMIARIYSDAAYAEAPIDEQSWLRANDAYRALIQSASG